jgi:ribosome biogenesis GTPase / thiamine phosphate phosphatase
MDMLCEKKLRMELERLGFTPELEKFRNENNLHDYKIGRVIAEYKERYSVRTIDGDVDGEITGKLRFTADSREDFPAVGDWVALQTYESDFAIIHAILPRYSILKRQSAGQSGNTQIIATNIDYALLIQAVDRDFNLNRLERYLTICYSSGIQPIIVLSKTDLIDEANLSEIKERAASRVPDVPVITVSNQTQQGYDALHEVMEKGKTYCMLGSSGVGKSTLLNNLSGRILMRTDTVSQSTGKGRHVTSHRELVVLDGGAIVIDNPGMREVGITDSAGGLETTFDHIFDLSQNCKFKDCTHTTEIGCAVIAALEEGKMDKAAYENYLKMVREKAFFESTVAERRRRERIFGRILKDYHKKDVKRRKY